MLRDAWGCPFLPSALVPEGACDVHGNVLAVPETEPEEYACWDFVHYDALEAELNEGGGPHVLPTDHVWNVPDREWRERYWTQWFDLVEAEGLPEDYGRRLMPSRPAEPKGASP